MTRLVLIAALAALMLAGCGKESPPPPPPAPVKAPDVAPAAAATDPAKSAGSAVVPSPATATAAFDDKKAQEVMNKAGCAACHALDKKGVGPAYTEVAKKRKGEKDASAMLVKKIRDGGTGAYGQIPMPPNSSGQISDDELKAMVNWVLTK